MLFVEPSDELDPDTIAIRSGGFVLNLLREAENEIEAAQARLDDAIERFDEEDWGGGSVIVQAERNLEQAQAAHDALLLKHQWEERQEWKKTFPPNPATFSPWVNDPARWLRNFRRSL